MRELQERDIKIIERLNELCQLNGVGAYVTIEERKGKNDERQAYLVLADKNEKGIWIGAASNKVIEALGQVSIDMENNKEYRAHFPSLDMWNEMDEKQQDRWIIDNLFYPVCQENMLLESGRMHDYDFVASDFLKTHEFQFITEEGHTKEDTIKGKLRINEENFKWFAKFQDMEPEAKIAVDYCVNYEKSMLEKYKGINFVPSRNEEEEKLFKEKEKDVIFKEDTKPENPEISAIFKNFYRNNVQTAVELGKWAGGKAKEVAEEFEQNTLKVKEWTSQHFDEFRIAVAVFANKVKEPVNVFVQKIDEFNKKAEERRIQAEEERRRKDEERYKKEIQKIEKQIEKINNNDFKELSPKMEHLSKRIEEANKFEEEQHGYYVDMVKEAKEKYDQRLEKVKENLINKQNKLRDYFGLDREEELKGKFLSDFRAKVEKIEEKREKEYAELIKRKDDVDKTLSSERLSIDKIINSELEKLQKKMDQINDRYSQMWDKER